MARLNSPKKESSPALKKINKKLSDLEIEQPTDESGHRYKRILWLVVLLFIIISLVGWGFSSQLIYDEKDHSHETANYKHYFGQVSIFVTSTIDLLVIYYIMKKLVDARNNFFGKEFTGLALYGIKLAVIVMLVFMIIVSYGQVLVLQPIWDNNGSEPGETTEKNIKRLAMLVNFVLLILATLLCIHQI